MLNDSYNDAHFCFISSYHTLDLRGFRAVLLSTNFYSFDFSIGYPPSTTL